MGIPIRASEGTYRKAVTAFAAALVILIVGILCVPWVAMADPTVVADKVDYTRFQESGYYLELIEDSTNKVERTSATGGSFQMTKAVPSSHITETGGFTLDWSDREHVPTYNPVTPTMYMYSTTGNYYSEPGFVFISSNNVSGER